MHCMFDYPDICLEGLKRTTEHLRMPSVITRIWMCQCYYLSRLAIHLLLRILRTYSGVFLFKNAADFMCDCDCVSALHSQHYMNFIDLCRKLVGRSTVYNLAIGLSDGSGERMFSMSKRNGCCHLCSFSCWLNHIVIFKNHLMWHGFCSLVMFIYLGYTSLFVTCYNTYCCTFHYYVIIEMKNSTTLLLFHWYLYLFTAVADAIRTSLGPRGMDKMVSLTS
jgi:hypothetical protein